MLNRFRPFLDTIITLLQMIGILHLSNLVFGLLHVFVFFGYDLAEECSRRQVPRDYTVQIPNEKGGSARLK